MIRHRTRPMTEAERAECDPVRFLRAERKFRVVPAVKAIVVGLIGMATGAIIMYVTTREASWVAMFAVVGALLALLGLAIAFFGVQALYRVRALREDPALRAAFDRGAAEEWAVDVDMAWDVSFESGDGDLIPDGSARILRSTDGSLLYVSSVSLSEVARGPDPDHPLCPASLVITSVAGMTTIQAKGEPLRRMRVAPTSACIELAKLDWSGVRMLRAEELPRETRAMIAEG